jgi:hypothetical protein
VYKVSCLSKTRLLRACRLGFQGFTRHPLLLLLLLLLL